MLESNYQDLYLLEESLLVQLAFLWKNLRDHKQGNDPVNVNSNLDYLDLLQLVLAKLDCFAELGSMELPTPTTFATLVI